MRETQVEYAPCRVRYNLVFIAPERLLIPQAISNSQFGQNIRRLTGTGLNFPAQIADIHAQQSGIILIGSAPYLLNDPALGNNFTGILDQDAEDIKLDGGQVNLLARSGHLVMVEINNQIPDLIYRQLANIYTPPHDNLYAG